MKENRTAPQSIRTKDVERRRIQEIRGGRLTTRGVGAEVTVVYVGLRGGVASYVTEELDFGTFDGGRERRADEDDGKDFH